VHGQVEHQAGGVAHREVRISAPGSALGSAAFEVSAWLRFPHGLVLSLVSMPSSEARVDSADTCSSRPPVSGWSGCINERGLRLCLLVPVVVRSLDESCALQPFPQAAPQL